MVAAFSTLLNALMWFTRGHVSRYEEGLKRIEEVERTLVTRLELKDLSQDIERKQDFQHAEIKNSFREILEKIDSNEKRRSDTEHAIRDTVSDLKLKFAVMEALAKQAGVEIPEKLK